MNFNEAVITLKNKLVLKHKEYDKKPKINENLRRLELIRMIELIVVGVMKSIANDELPVLKTTNHCNFDTCFYDERLNSKTVGKTKNIHFRRINSRSNFTIIIFLLSEIHELLTKHQSCTRRELYYKNLHIIKSQKQIDECMKDVCYLLKAPAWELGVFASSKGIVSGPVILKLTNGDFLDCSNKGGVSIPTNVLEVENIFSTASWILIIEKDAAFQKFICNESGSKLKSCILITGKGFPDISTRMLVCKFWESLRIPIFALVDADPHGFEIMCVYRYGSASMSSYSEYLACPAVRWLGVHPTDIKPLLIESKTLSLRDIRKIGQLLKRDYIGQNEKLKRQLEILLKENKKAEIEGVANISATYLLDTYVRNKIQCHDYF